jgi:hypothetical protein
MHVGSVVDSLLVVSAGCVRHQPHMPAPDSEAAAQVEFQGLTSDAMHRRAGAQGWRDVPKDGANRISSSSSEPAFESHEQ